MAERVSAAGLVRAFAAGALAANAVPHGVSGVQGRRFPSPFGSPPGVGESSPGSNVVWSALNAGASAALARGAVAGSRGRLAFGAGAAVGALLVGRYFAGVAGRS